MYPRMAFTRVQLVCDRELLLGIFQPSFIIASVHRVFAQKLITRGLREQNIVLLTKRDRASCPAIGFVIKSVVLITAGRVGVDLRNHRRGKRADSLALRGGRNDFTGTQQQLNRFLMTAGKVMKARRS